MEEDSQRRHPFTLDRKASNLGSQHDKEKMKITILPITTFTVGNWKRKSTHIGNLTAKFFYDTTKQVVWEFHDVPLNYKMEVSWSDITAIEAVMNPNQPGILRIQLAKPPLFFQEIPPPPRHHPNWKKADDFTNGQALICRTHVATFPPGALDKHYEKLLINDERLAELSRMPFPTLESVFPLQHIAASASSNDVTGNQINNEPTFVDSSRQNHRLIVPDQQHYQYNDMAVTNEPAFVDGSSSEAQYLAEATVDEEALAEAIVREANKTCDDDTWSLLEQYMKQSQEEDHCNAPVGGGNVNEASSVSPASPPSKP